MARAALEAAQGRAAELRRQLQAAEQEVASLAAADLGGPPGGSGPVHEAAGGGAVPSPLPTYADPPDCLRLLAEAHPPLPQHHGFHVMTRQSVAAGGTPENFGPGVLAGLLRLNVRWDPARPFEILGDGGASTEEQLVEALAAGVGRGGACVVVRGNLGLAEKGPAGA